jgi:hypothetical protein
VVLERVAANRRSVSETVATSGKSFETLIERRIIEAPGAQKAAPGQAKLPN